MGIFSRKQDCSSPTSRAYLRMAPPGPRTDALVASCLLRALGLPIAAADRLGDPVTAKDLVPFADVVSEVMAQDRDLSGPIARKAMNHLHVATRDYMAGDAGVALDSFFEENGVRTLPTIELIRKGALSDDEVEVAEAYARLAFSVFCAYYLGPAEAGKLDWELYSDLHTGASGRDVESLAYDMVAWMAIGVARQVNARRIPSTFPILDERFRSVARMSEAGWYPNPLKLGGIEDGDAVLQRYWDGTGWTDQMRMRKGRGYEYASISLHSEPVD